MGTVGDVLIGVALLAFLGCVVWFIVALSKRRGRRLPAILMGVSLTIMVLGAIITPDRNQEPLASNGSAAMDGGTTRLTPTLTPTPVPTSTATPASTPTPTLSQIPFPQLKGMAAQVSYDDLFRNNERHVGEVVYYQGQIVQVLNDGKDRYQLRANVTQGVYLWEDTVYLRYSGSRMLENDIIEFVGKVNGLVTYKSIFGQEIAIPDISVIQTQLIAKASDPTPTPAPTPTPTLSPTAPVTATPTSTPAPGSARANSAEIGTELSIKVDNLLGYYEARVTLLEVVRGEGAWSRVQQANRFNSPPQAGFEYILARVRFDYLNGKDPNTQYDLSDYDFDAVSSDGKDYERVSVVEPKPTLSAKLYPGASHEGWVAFQVAQQDTRPLMTFGRGSQGRGGLWWKLYK